jgi:hypothetical protein
MIVDGQRLDPEAATWIRILSFRTPPDNMLARTDWKPRDVFRWVYATVWKAFRRAELKKSTCVSTEKFQNQGLSI